MLDLNHGIEELKQDIKGIRLSDEDKEVIKWLTQDAIQQPSTQVKGQAGTGTWFLQSDLYSQWQRGVTQTLICPGMPGAGKTVMTSFVLHDLRKTYGEQCKVLIAAIYCRYQLKEKQQPEKILSTLVSQLLPQLLQLPATLQKLLLEFREVLGFKPSLEQLQRVLKGIVSGPHRTFVVIDALDECTTLDRGRLVETIRLLQMESQGKVSFLATTRGIPEILELFEYVATLEVRASEEDICRYIDARIPELVCKAAKHDAILCKEIKDTILRSVGGMYVNADMAQ